LESAAYLTDVGYQLTREDRWEEGVAKYQQAIDVDPRHGRAYSNLAYALNRLGRYSEAIDVLDKGVNVTKDTVLLHRMYDTRGFSKSNLKDFTGAIEDFTRAMEVNASNPRVFYHRAESEAQAGLFDEAYDDVEKALDLDRSFAPALRLKTRLDGRRFREPRW